MKGGAQDTKGDVGNLESREVATNQQGQRLPVFQGEAKLAAIWISEPWGQFTRPAPKESRGKK